MGYENYIPVVEVTRGAIVESVHFGAAAVVDSSGKLIAQIGDPQTSTFLRSSAKPFQALPFVEMGGVGTFKLSMRELAVLCASHTGTDDHFSVVSGIQEKIGVTEQDLLCGTHPPYDLETAKRLLLQGLSPTPNRHNCSGKHTGMLAHVTLRRLDKKDYVNPAHPVQQSILAAFCQMCEIDAMKVELGTDGCSAPVFAVPLYNAALAFARLADPAGLPERRADALRMIYNAMTSNPDMISGPRQFDTRLMEVMGGKVVVKGGAEGYQALGIAPGVLGPGKPGVGITFKISDGDTSNRARPVVTLEILRQLGVLSASQASALAEFDRRKIQNWRKLDVGEIRTCFKLA